MGGAAWLYQSNVDLIYDKGVFYCIECGIFLLKLIVVKGFGCVCRNLPQNFGMMLK